MKQEKNKMHKVDNAIILAAGFGSRFVPLTFDLPKGLIPVKGTPMVERQIVQLKEKNIHEIVIVVGYLKEKFDYLIDRYNVSLVFNPEFTIKNNLSSLYCTRNYLKNTYILSADNWIENSIFNTYEDESWYSCIYKKGETSEWCVTTDDSGRIINVIVGGQDSWVMLGPVFLSESFSDRFRNKIEEYYHKTGTENYMWENVFIDEIDKFDLYINKQSGDNVYEFENLEELRVFDPDYGNDTLNKSLKIISNVFNVGEKKIIGFQCMKSGMTNKSFSFTIGNASYIFRKPGEGSDILINRKQEKAVYNAITKLHISDENIYLNENTGEKISIFYPNAVNTDAHKLIDIQDSMKILQRVHRCGILVGHSFDIGNEIERYMLLCQGKNAMRFTDYKNVHKNMKRLFLIVERFKIPQVLCHVDCNPDNFIRLRDNTIKIIDWEYSGMGDPLMDIAMYSIYAYYTKEEALRLLSIYLNRQPERNEILRLYAYMALGGYLWSLWAEYKQAFGVEFGNYGMKMYRYAKEYYVHFMDQEE
ncbi:choline kinase [Spirochaetia bacterium]|nr:choline kinase [Spirochaetia bacterium]